MSDMQIEVGIFSPANFNSIQTCCPKSGHPADNTLVTALGSSMRGDDGVGIVVLDRLTKYGNFPDSIYFHYDSSPLHLMDAFLSQKFRKVIIVDSAYLDQNPGEWQRFILNDNIVLNFDRNTNISMHGLGLAGVLELCNALNIGLPEIVIYGVQPKEVNFSNELSDIVQNAVPAICNSILKDLRN